MRPFALLLCAVAPLAAQAPPKRQLVEEVRLDATTEDFPDVSTVAVNARGDMAVFVSKDQQLRFYDASGRKAGTFGRTGSGPGEFRRSNTWGWVGDTLWGYDADLRRVTYISPARQLLRTDVLSQSLNSMMRTQGGAPAGPARPPGDGAVLLFSVRAVVADRYVGSAVIAAGKLPDGRQDSKSAIASVSRAAVGDTLDSRALAIIAQPPDIGANMMRWAQADGKASASMVVPFTFSPATVFSADGRRIAVLTVEPGPTGGTYTLKVMRTTGETLLSRSYPFTGIPIPSSVADSAKARLGIQPDGRQMFPPAAMDAFRSEIRTRFPKFYSPVGSVHLGRDNATWIQLRRPDPKSAATMILLDDRGNAVATVDLPPRHRVVYTSKDQLWAVVTDEDDLPSVVRYRIR